MFPFQLIRFCFKFTWEATLLQFYYYHFYFHHLIIIIIIVIVWLLQWSCLSRLRSVVFCVVTQCSPLSSLLAADETSLAKAPVPAGQVGENYRARSRVSSQATLCGEKICVTARKAAAKETKVAFNALQSLMGIAVWNLTLCTFLICLQMKGCSRCGGMPLLQKNQRTYTITCL